MSPDISLSRITSSITYDGIELAVSKLKYTNPNVLKYKYLNAIRRRYTSQDSIDRLLRIDQDDLIREIWNIEDDPQAVKTKRKNLNSIRSTVNTDLNKLYKSGDNPEGITINPDHIFAMSDQAKSDRLQAYSHSVQTNDQIDLDAVSEVLNMINDFISKYEGLDRGDGSDQTIDKIKDILNELKGMDLDIQEQPESIEPPADDAFEDVDEIDEDEVDILDEDDIEEVEELDDDELEDVDEDEIEEVDEDELDSADEDEIEDVDDEELDTVDEDEIEEVDDEELDIVDEDEIEEVDDEELDTVDEDEIEEVDDEELDIVDEDEIEEVDDEELDIVNEDEIEEVDDEELDIVDEDEIEEVDDEELDSVDEDEIEEVDDEELDSVDEDEIEEVDDEELDIVDEDEIEEVDDEELDSVDEDEIEEVDDEELDIVDEDEIEEVDDEELDTVDEDEIEEVDDEELDIVDEDEIEEVDDEELDIVDEDEIEEVDDKELDSVDEDEIEEVDDDELDIVDEDEIEEVDDDALEDLGLSAGLEGSLDSGIPDDETAPVISDSEKNRQLAEQFVKHLGTIDRYYNSFLNIPEGYYTIGSPKPKRTEILEYQTLVSSFYIGKFPITNSLFEVFINKTGYRTTAEKIGYGMVYSGRYQKHIDKKTGQIRTVWKTSHSYDVVKGACWYNPNGPSSSIAHKLHHPVVQVSLEDALAFASWIGKSIPTEIQWESASRTQNGYAYPWGNQWVLHACNMEDSAIADTTPVDQYLDFMNDFDLADFSGNVMEWTADTISSPYKNKKNDIYVVAKGGCFISEGPVPLWARFIFKDGYTSNTVGFRCAVL